MIPLWVRAVLRVAGATNGRTDGIVPPLAVSRLRWTSPWVLVVGAALAAAGQTGAAAGQFTSRVSLVEVYATVTDSAGRPVPNLRQDDFIVEEDGTRQPIQAFASGSLSLSVAVGVDRSFSMTDKTLAAAVTAARAFADRLRPADQLMVLGIGSEVEVLAPLSADHAVARRALARLARWGTTPLYDAVLQSIDAVQPAPGRRALILLSDGEDRYSRTSASDLVAYARQHDVLVYPVALGPSRQPIWAEVAAASGGRSFAVRELRDVGPALESIAEELRHQYLVGYAPPADGRSGWRSIRLRVSRPQLRVRARDGYFATGP